MSGCSIDVQSFDALVLNWTYAEQDHSFLIRHTPAAQGRHAFQTNSTIQFFFEVPWLFDMQFEAIFQDNVAAE